MGFNNRIGKDGEGTFEVLKAIGEKHHLKVLEAERIEVSGQAMSSTAIRQHVQNGDFHWARKMLGRAYGIEGIVTRGHGIGRQLLYPTANLEIQNRVVPLDGVYITLCLVDQVWYRSVTNIGKRPTFGGEIESKVETHLLDFDRDLYDQTIRIRLLHRLRGEKKFSGVDQLKSQIAYDCDRAVRYFSSDFIRRNLQYV